MFTVFDELTQVSESDFLRFRVLLDDADDRVDDRLLVLEAALCDSKKV